MKNFLLLFSLFAFFSTSFANTRITIQKEIKWADAPVIHNPTGNFAKTIWTFEHALHSDLHPTLPLFSERHAITSGGKVTARIVNAQYEAFDKPASEDDDYVTTDIQINSKVFKDRGQHFIYYSFIPIRKTASGNFERITSFELTLDFEAVLSASPRNDYTFNSELSNGTIYKVAVSETGIHKLTHEFLKDIGIDMDELDPSKIRILGNGGGMLPEIVGEERYDDLQEVSILVNGEADGQFNENDYILFYAEGPNKKYFDEESQRYIQPPNIYSDENYYFIKIDSQNGLRISDQASINSTDYSTSEYDFHERFEEETFNLLHEAVGTQGSGRQWFGDPFNPTRERSYKFDVPNINTASPVGLDVNFAGRGKSNHNYQVIVDGQTFTSPNIPRVIFADSEGTHAQAKSLSNSFIASSNNIDVVINYPSFGDGTNIGWLDYVEINARAGMNLVSGQLEFSDKNTLAYNSATFQLGNVNSNTIIWDITDPFTPKLQAASSNGGQLSFGTEINNQLKKFIAFDPSLIFPSPIDSGLVANQNIHGIDDVDLAIIYFNKFEEAAKNLRDHRVEYSGYNVALVDIDQVFNEFGGGRRDVTAIRDFAKMLYDRNPDKFKYLLLIGDGTFDFKDKTEQGKNFIPPFESITSLNGIRAFPSDDFFGLLSEGEGPRLVGALDISVGRIPARTMEEANGVIQKIINYDSNPNTLGDWRNRLTFCADDEDGNTHVNQADNIAERVRNAHDIFNLNKIYFDAFQQEPTPGGDRFPKANETINRSMFKGHLVMNYLGHGGSRGWAQERVLTNDDIAGWNNPTALPLLVTATCSFTGYDEPSITTAGEQAILKSDGGVIGLFTTTRAVYSSANKRLTTAVFDTIFQEPGQPVPAIGEILRMAKNANSADTLETNSRKFTLIGDPSMKLAVPKHSVTTSKINGVDVSSGAIDTIRALQRVTIEGFVTNANGAVLTNFNGVISPTVFDKEISSTTLGQDSESSEKTFKTQQSIIFRGNASVTNGAFSFSFVVPKDINYDFGKGRISYYAHDQVKEDAAGYFENFIIGGTDPNATADDEGPLVEVFMDNEDFVFGGITNSNPTLIVKLKDDNGINVVGNSIGHDLTGVIDENTQETYILNDFYESELDDYTKGEVRFPLFNLEEGRHVIKAKAWDIANNSGEGYTEFLVTSDEDIALDYVLNYPNPFTTCTNFQFEHNIKDQGVEVQITVFTISGKIVKTIESQVYTDGGRIGGIKWDGTDDYGDRLGKGVYLYRVKVRSDDQKTTESDFEKLVILK